MWREARKLLDAATLARLLPLLLCWAIFGQEYTAAQGEATLSPTYKSGDFYLAGCRAYMYVGKTGLGHEHAVVGRIQRGSLQLGATRNAGEIVFDMATFRVDTDAARKYIGLTGTTSASTQKQTNDNMLGKAVLDVASYPTATFKVDSATPLDRLTTLGLSQYKLVGVFTLHGKSRPITVVANVEQKDDWVHLRGEFSILQSDYGIKRFTKAFGSVGVTDQLKIWGDFWLAKQRSVQRANAARR